MSEGLKSEGLGPLYIKTKRELLKMNELIVHKHALAMHQEKHKNIGKKINRLMDQPYTLAADEKMTKLEMESKAARDSIKFHEKRIARIEKGAAQNGKK